MTDREIQAVYEARCFERARRLARAELARTTEGGARRTLLELLFRSCRRLGDIKGCCEAVALLEPETGHDRLWRELRLAENDLVRAAGEHYRTSEEGEAGLSVDEYMEKYRALACRRLAGAVQLATSPDLREELEHELRRLSDHLPAELDAYLKRELAALGWELPPLPEPEPESWTGPRVRFSGRLLDGAGQPAAGVRLVLQYFGAPERVDYHQVLVVPDCGGILRLARENPRVRRFETVTGAAGAFAFDGVPATGCDYLAALPPVGMGAYPVRFLALGREIDATPAEFRLEEWRPAPAKALPAVPAVRRYRGRELELVAGTVIDNPFDYRFPRQYLTLELPAPAAELLLFNAGQEEPIPFQELPGGRAGLLVELPPESTLRLGFYRRPPEFAAPGTALRATDRGAYWEIETGSAAYRIAGPAAPAGTPPILSVKGPDGVWRGKSRLVLGPGVATPAVAVRQLEAGPVELVFEVTLTFAPEQVWRYTLTFHENESYVLIREDSIRLDEVTAWEFAFPEFIGERLFLNGNAEESGVHWLVPQAEDRELARIQESVAWWLPGQVFGVGLTFDGLERHDYVGVFSLRRGEWRDEDFARIANGPGDDRRELDWPFPEMVGSTLSMLTVHSRKDGEVVMRFGGFNGQRQWGLLISDFDRCDGPYRELSLVQHKNSSPRLEHFRQWRLNEPETLARPLLLTRRDRIDLLRERILVEPFKQEFERIERESAHGGDSTGMAELLGQHPERIALLREWILYNARLRSKMVLQGRDSGDVYSPVGGRPITPMAACYDLLAPTGVFSPEEEQLIRAYFMLMGHMYMEPDFMNWHYNSRNANFEADRVDIIGNIGLIFPENPDSKAFADHGIELMRRSFEVYCTPGSGKWYENPACYYLHAASCRLNLVYHLWQQGRFDSSEIERLKDFLRWGILLLTPEAPAWYRDWCLPGDWFKVPRARLVPPVGDHAELGKRLSDFYWLLAPMYDRRDPAFADELRWAWQVTHRGENGVRSPHLLLATDNPPPADPHYPAPRLVSRRLEGFGAILRDHFDTPEEFYVLFKLGPGGYRYHRTEGGFLYFAHGRALVYDGGEAGETWRHATLSFHDTHLPLAPGHLERFVPLSRATLAQGVNPKAINPGEPVFLSDRCDHQLVAEAIARFREPNPLNHRSLLAVRDEYLIVHDDLLGLAPEIPVFWHLPVVADACRELAPRVWRFRGRFGVDLEVALPDLPLRGVELGEITHEEYGRRNPEFRMKHLQLQLDHPGVVGAVLRPLLPETEPVTVAALRNEHRQVGLEIRNSRLHDRVFINREPVTFESGSLRFSGRYALLEERGSEVYMTLFDAGSLEFDGWQLESSGAPVTARRCGAEAVLVEGEGRLQQVR